MDSCSSVLSEEQFLCSICLEVFTEPVSTPCGHIYCKACITGYWDSNDLYRCPVCKQKFDGRPELHVNTTVRDVVERFKRMSEKKMSVREGVREDDESFGKPGDVSCDICTESKLKALKSCLVCLTSYCETQLEPHQRVAALKRHKLIDPVENLEERLCKKHDKLLELFCRKDQACVCIMCMNTDHKTHNAVPLEEEYLQRKAKLAKMMADNYLMMETRSRKVQEIKLSVDTSRKDADREISESVEVFSALVCSIERSQAELIEVIERKQKATEKQAEGFIKDLEKEIAELKRRSSELEKLLHTEDHLHLLQSFSSLGTPPHTKDWSKISVHSDLSVGTVRRAVSQLEDSFMVQVKKLCDAELKRIQQYSVDVTVDPYTAHIRLILSDDGKQVRCAQEQKMNLPVNPERFDMDLSVLGKQSFSSGRFYYKVQVKGKTDWELGVARESINRKGHITLNPKNGYWTWMRNGDEYTALENTRVSLSLREKPQKVGVFVDYEEGQVSFYDVEAKSHIYSYTGCTFTEKLYPLFGPCNYCEGGRANSAPLVITPVTHTG